MRETLLLYTLLLLWQIPVLAQGKKFRLDPSLTEKDYAPNTVIVKFKSLPATINERQLAPASPADLAILKKLNAFKIHKTFSNLKQINYQRNTSIWNRGKKSVDLSQIYTIRINPKYNLEQAINILLEDESVEYAEPAYNHQPLAYISSDPGAQTGGEQYYLDNIKARQAWEVEKGDTNITIGIIDYGFYLAHDDLKDNIQYNKADPIDGIDNDKDGYIDNYAGWDVAENDKDLYENPPHGSFVAGIASASTDNNKGMAGVGFKCRFLPVKIFSNPKQVFAGYQGIIYAVQHGCQVINLSWGRRGAASALEQDVINYAAINFDVVVVAAAGNNGTADLYYPASYDNVISVAGTDWNDVKWDGSNYNEKVDLSAPGLYIYSAIDNQTPYGKYGGTSFAAPQVAGAAALVRSRYPEMTSQEVAELLIATTDNVNSIPANAAYAGKMGSGRLNIERAIKKELYKRLQLINTTVKNHQGQLYAQNGDTVSLVINLKSIYGNYTNLQASIRSLSPYVQVLQPNSSFGSFLENTSSNNQNLPFKIVIDKATPTKVFFATLEITYSDEAFTATDQIALPINQNCITIQNKNISLSVSSQGRIGYNDDIIGWYGEGRGTGFQYKNTDLLTEAGLMLGTNKGVADNTLNAQVNSVFYDNQTIYGPLFTKNTHFAPNQHLGSVTIPAKDIALEGTFIDTVKNRNPNPLGVLVKQQYYTWQDSKFIIIEYQLTNISGNTIDKLYAGIFSIWNNLGINYNQAKWDAGNSMGYVFNTAANSLYTGVQLLTDHTPNYYVMDNDPSSIPILDGFSAEEKYKSLSSGLTRSQSISSPQFTAHTLAAQLQELVNGETRTIAFALLAGDNLSDLQASAGIAKQKFMELKTGPLPVITDLYVCKNDDVSLAPANGTNFKFYANSSLHTVIAQGKSFELNEVTKDTTLYITNVDSLYESKATTVHIRVDSVKTNFWVANDTLGLYEKEILELTDKSTNATKWLWNFGDGTKSDLQNPTHTYTVPGEYFVKLTTENSIGCTDTLSQKVLVVKGIKSLTPHLWDMIICKGEVIKIAPGNGNNFQIYTSLPPATPVSSGSTFMLGAAVKDTTFYITNTDFLFESDPATIHIRVVNHTTSYEVASDTLDLFQNEELSVTDKSSDATKWLWDFGDGEVSTEQNPRHTYTATGEYTLKLITHNSNNCIDSLSRKIWVVRTTGLPEDLNNYIKLYPNPSDSWLYVELDKTWLFNGDSTLEVYTNLGQVIYRANIQGHTHAINLSRFSKGVYSVKIIVGDKIIIRKITRF